MVLAKHAIRTLRSTEVGQVKWFALKQDMKDPEFDLNKYLSKLNQAQKQTVYYLMKLTHDQQNQAFYQSKPLELINE